MKNFYLKGLKSLALVACIAFMGTTAFGQEDLSWRGSVSENANNEENWEPSGVLDGNNINVGDVGTYADPDNPVHPVVTGSEEISINQISVSGDAYIEEEVDEEGEVIEEEYGPYDGGQLTISMDEAEDVQFRVNGGEGHWIGGTIIVNQGTMSWRKNMMLEDGGEPGTLIVEGTGYVEFDDHFGMGNTNPREDGASGMAYIRDDGEILVKDQGKLIRFGPESVLEITDNGRLIINGDNRGYGSDIDEGFISGGTDFFIHYYYDPIANQTYFEAHPNEEPLAYFTDREPESAVSLTANEEGPEIAVENSALTESATQFEWKYGTSAEGPFDQTIATSTDTSVVNPSIDASGKVYVVCEITTPDGTYTTNALEFIVGSDKFEFNHSATQYLRGDQTGATIEVTSPEGDITNGVWKYSTTAGEGHVEFDPSVTGTEYTPSFEEEGEYFVMFEGEIDGVTEISSEIRIVKQAQDAGAVNITWTGAVDDDFHNIANWTPMAYPNKNNVIITPDAEPFPVMTQGTDTIMGGSQIQYQAPEEDEDGNVITEEKWAQLIIRATDQDTLYWRGDTYGLRGELNIESGVFQKEAGLLRIDANSSTINVSGTGQVIFETWNDWNPALMMGNADTPSTGGQVHISEQGKVYFNDPGGIFRMSTDPEADFTFFTLSDQGQMIHMGDQVSTYATYADNNRLRIPENHEHYIVYDPTTDYTHTKARDLNGFSIADAGTQFVSVGNTTSELTLANTEGLDNFTWKYSESPMGPWTAFDPSVDGEAALVPVDELGTMYVAAEAGDGSVTNNALRVEGIDFAVQSTEDAGVYTLSIELPEGMTDLGWQRWNDNEGAYTEFSELGEELETEISGGDFLFVGGDGEHTISYLGVMQDDAGNDVDIFASPVVVTVEEGEITSIEEGTATSIEGAPQIEVGVTPNPNNGSFRVNAGVDNYTVEVINMAGSVVASEVVSGGDAQEMNIGQAGIYFVKVTTAEGVSVTKVIVK